MKNNGITKKALIALSAVRPGLFLIGYNIGTGSVTTMAKTGAEYGMGLFWALLLSCIFTYILMVAYGSEHPPICGTGFSFNYVPVHIDLSCFF